MINCPSHLLSDLINLLFSNVSLTDEQKTTIRQELDNDPESRGYSGMTNIEKCRALSYQYSINNPDAREVLPRNRNWDRGELASYIFTQMSPDGLQFLYPYLVNQSQNHPSDQIKQILQVALQAIFSSPLSSISFTFDPNAGYLSNSNHQMGIAILQAGVITQAQYDYIFKELDPNYQSVLDKPSRLEALNFGPGAMVTPQELEDILS